MLQRKVLEPRALDLLKELMRLSSLESFLLVGGTALALGYGHRISDDLDLLGKWTIWTMIGLMLKLKN